MYRLTKKAAAQRTRRLESVRRGKPWKDRIGWSAILAGLRKSMPRVGAE